ncbi:amidase [Aestuariimicrobium sp. Y1814]|uniref:amidase n=1 Tax=Aestuariimicrobium sp. Y1814 TaxID=3418742 RepID=UPI003DA71D21
MSARPRSVSQLHEQFASDPQSVVTQTHSSARAAELATEQLSAFTCVNSAAESTAQELATQDPAGRPLFGVPLSVKDSLHVTGLPRWHGTALATGKVSTFDSAPVQRLQEAGAVIVGKTSMSEMGLLASGLGSQFPVVRNPWNPAQTPGGSSSGAGASIAAGVTVAGIGTDIAGSVRLPAAHCGIVALKPTQNTLPYASASTWRSAGPMARTVADARTLFEVVSRTDTSDQLGFGYDVAPGSTRRPVEDLKGLRVGVMEWPGYGPRMNEDTARLFRGAVDLLAGAGAELVDYTLGATEQDFAALDRCLMVRGQAEIAAVEPDRVQYLLPQVRAWLDAGPEQSAADYYRDFEHLSARAGQLLSAASAFDLIVSPVMGDHTFPAEDFGPDLSKPLLHHCGYTAWWNQTGQPAMSLNMGLAADGMPVGLQLIARRRDDWSLLNIAEFVEAQLALDTEWPDLVVEA